MGFEDREYYLRKHGWNPVKLKGCRKSLEQEAPVYDEKYWRKISHRQYIQLQIIQSVLVVLAFVAFWTAVYYFTHRST